VTLRSHGHRSTHGSALAGQAAALALALAAACRKDTVVTSRTVTTYVPKACAVGGSGSATYTALGDYDETPADTVHLLSAIGTNLPEIDTNAKELVISVNDDTWEGLGPVPSSGDVNVLALPQLTPCPLTTGVGMRTGSTLAPIGSNRVMLVGGTAATETPATYVARLDTGEVTQVAPDLAPPRTAVSVTAFGDGALVAGGLPLDTPTMPTADAEVYSVTTNGFDAHIALTEPRAHHGAVVLPNGNTLLVGGLGGSDGKTVLGSMELVEPGSTSGTQGNVARLVTPRSDPIVVRLASGQILVAGGKDATGAPVTTMEWLMLDQQTGELTNMLQKAQPWGPSPFAMMALQGGGALVVETTDQSTWIVGEAQDIQQTKAVLPPLQQAVLFGGAGGAPVLWTGDHFVQWQPWGQAWGPFETLGSSTPNIQGDIASPDPGLGMWFDQGLQQLVALRFDKRNAYSELLVQGAAGGALGEVDFATDTSPNELPTPAVVSYDMATGLSVTSFGNAFITDRTYEDVTVHVASQAGAPGACVVLRTTSGPQIVLPDPGITPGTTLDVQRSGATVSFSIDGGPYQTSENAIGVGNRVAVGLRGSSATSPTIITDVRVTRPGTP
jgi:hypothetical protein